MEIKRNISISSNRKKYPILIDVFFKQDNKPKPIIIFCHGFKGFKDWGAFNNMGVYFADNNFVYVKFNFSHNGIKVENLENFTDLDAFGKNNFSIELDDLDTVINWLHNCNMISKEINLKHINLIGHSRGGGIAIIKASEDSRIKRIISLASPSDFLRSIMEAAKEKLELWKKKGVVYIYNGRTKQNMPMYYQFYEDCMKNKDRFSILSACNRIKIPHLVLHGDNDPTVPVDAAKEIKSHNSNAELHIIKGSDHVFNVSHPFLNKELPDALNKVLKLSLQFLKR